MRRIETIQAALNVLRCCVSRTAPEPTDLAVLRQAKGIDAEHMPWDELARAVVQQYLDDARERRAQSTGAA